VAEAPVELARRGGVEARDERLDEGRGRGGLGHAGLRRDAPGLGRGRATATRERRRQVGVRGEADRREHLGGDQLDAGLGGEPLAHHASQRALHAAEAGEDVARRGDAEHRALARLVVAGLRAARFERAHVAGPHLARERRRREPGGRREPAGLVRRRGHAAEEPRLRPAEPARAERRVEQREPRQRRSDGREVAQLATGHPRTLPRVVARPREAERLPASDRRLRRLVPARDERARDPRERPPQPGTVAFGDSGRTAPRERDEARVERLDRVDARVVAGFRDDGGCHARSSGGTEEADRSRMAGGCDRCGRTHQIEDFSCLPPPPIQLA